jgi:hypothetical protein
LNNSFYLYGKLKVMINYLFIILDRTDSSSSTVHPFKSKMQPLQAFRFAWEGNVDDDLEYFEEEIYPNLKMGDVTVSFDGEEYSYLLIKH